MIKVKFMDREGTNLDSRDMSLEQLHTLKLADTIDVEFSSYTLDDMGFNVDLNELYVWLKGKIA